MMMYRNISQVFFVAFFGRKSLKINFSFPLFVLHFSINNRIETIAESNWWSFCYVTKSWFPFTSLTKNSVHSIAFIHKNKPQLYDSNEPNWLSLDSKVVELLFIVWNARLHNHVIISRKKYFSSRSAFWNNFAQVLLRFKGARFACQ